MVYLYKRHLNIHKNVLLIIHMAIPHWTTKFKSTNISGYKYAVLLKLNCINYNNIMPTETK